MKNSNGLTVEHKCTQCGAPISFEETDHLVECGFCKARLCVSGGDVLRFYFAPQVPAENIIFVPYWRIKGSSYSVVGFEMVDRAIDINYLASRLDFLPLSLGPRPQTIKLKFLTPDVKGTFAASGLSLDEAISRAEKISSIEVTETIRHSAFMCDVKSMLYSPFFIKGSALYDAVTNRPVANCGEYRAEMLSTAETAGWKVDFLPAICPNCGWDIRGRRESIAFSCNNCNSIWHVTDTGFTKMPFGIVRTKDTDAYYIPFWRIKADVSQEAPKLQSKFDSQRVSSLPNNIWAELVKIEESLIIKADLPQIKLDTYADLIRVANLPKAIKKEWEKREAYFWIPAFRATTRLFLRISSFLTANQPDFQTEEDASGLSLSPVTLSAEDAGRVLKIVFASVINTKKILYPILPAIDIKPAESALVYIPFKPGAMEYRNEDIGFSIPKNAIKE